MVKGKFRFVISLSSLPKHGFRSVPIMPSNHSISRRSLLRGAGAMLALPWLESLMYRQARAAGERGEVRPPLRMGIVSVTGGTVIESWRLPQGGTLEKLPSILRPLEFAKKDLLLVTGLSHSGRTENLNGHEACGYTHLTAAPLAKREGGKSLASISIDQLVAQHAGQETILPSLEIGLSNHETQYSFRSADTPVPYEADPRLVYERMFRGRTPIVPNWQRRAAAKEAAEVRASADSYDASVIDLVREQAARLRTKLGRLDRDKLDQYLFSVRSVEKRIATLEARLKEEALDAASPGPGKLIDPKMPAKEIPFYRFRDLVYRDPEKHGEYIRLMSELMVLAFQTDTTRVCTLAVGDDGAYFPGVVTVGYEQHCHTLEHQGNAARVEEADPIAREACRQIHAWYTSLFAEMVRSMQGIEEGGSTLLDNSLLLYTSYMADGGHGRDDYPKLLVGNAQGTLNTGRQIDFPKHTPVANLYMEMIDRMGVAVEEFGDSKTSKYASFEGRLPGLGIG